MSAKAKRDDEPQWMRLAPPFHEGEKSAPIFLSYVKKLVPLAKQAESDEVRHKIQLVFAGFIDDASTWPGKDRQMILAAARVLTDLAEQGWHLTISRTEGVLTLPPDELKEAGAEKERVRRQELLKRTEQLRQPAVQQFILSMERRRPHNGRFVSIFSLMRNGRELAAALRQARSLNTEEALKGIIDPYLQFVSPGERCSFTGFELQEIWRYFRHTWTNQYTSVPGRSMMFLVRDRAASCHPVMGIGALCSPIVQISARDKWIGWHRDVFLPAIQREPTTRIAEWLVKIVDQAIKDLYLEDFLEEKMLALETLRAPTEEVIAVLIAEGASARERHHRYVESQEHKRPRTSGAEDENGSWQQKARTHLFRSKRALTLAELLNARMVLGRFFSAQPTAQELASLLNDVNGVRVVQRILRKAKGDRVGIAMADISVCGAVQPYNAILGGKLVSMLAVSPEAVLAYRERYARAESEIASGMAGRPIVRPSHLVFFGTTSLYGSHASQYNRIKIPCGILSGREVETIRYADLGDSDAYGTSQYSDETVDALVALVQQMTGGQRVNSIFGEGVSPKLRKIRGGLELLDFPADELLQHGRKRIVYGVSMVRNLREYLLGIETEPDYLIPIRDGAASTKAIADWWKRRWLCQSRRLESDAVLSEVERHTLMYPIVHGARVERPPDDEHQESFPFSSPS